MGLVSGDAASSRMVGQTCRARRAAIRARMHDLATKRILRWAADPRVDARMLRRALDDVLAADRLTAPVSDALKLEYLAATSGTSERTEAAVPARSRCPAGKDGLLDRFVPGTGGGTMQQMPVHGRRTTSREAGG